jgi:hypothetical protein
MPGTVRDTPWVRLGLFGTLSCAALAAALMGCGGGRGSRTTRAEAVAFADAVNLRRGDVSQMHAFGGNDGNGSLVRFELKALKGCGVSDRGERFDVYSPVFSTARGDPQPLPAEDLHSRVAVMRSADEQKRDFATQACDLRRSSEASAGSQVLPSPVPGLPVFGLRTHRIAPGWMFRDANVTRYSDGFSFVVGAAEVRLAVISAPRPPRPGLERRLLLLLYERARQLKPVLSGKRALVIQ